MTAAKQKQQAAQPRQQTDGCAQISIIAAGQNDEGQEEAEASDGWKHRRQRRGEFAGEIGAHTLNVCFNCKDGISRSKQAIRLSVAALPPGILILSFIFVVGIGNVACRRE